MNSNNNFNARLNKLEDEVFEISRKLELHNFSAVVLSDIITAVQSLFVVKRLSPGMYSVSLGSINGIQHEVRIGRKELEKVLRAIQVELDKPEGSF